MVQRSGLAEGYGPDEGTVHYAVGDVHGCLPQMLAALDWCSADADDRGMKGVVHLLGDYVDRGPDSRGVIEALLSGAGGSHMAWRPLKGNHDHDFAAAWRDPQSPAASGWWVHGGQQTLASYGWNPMDHPAPDHLGEWVPESHIAFLESLPVAAATPQALFVHAGMRAGIPLEGQSARDLMWIRGAFLRSAYDFGRPVVHGHTYESGNPAVRENRVALDSGCFATGILSAAAFDPGSPLPRLARFGPRGLIESFDQSFRHG